LLDRGEGQVSKEYLEYQIMKEMGWTYQELMECPLAVYTNILGYMNTEGKFYKARSKNG